MANKQLIGLSTLNKK